MDVLQNIDVGLVVLDEEFNVQLWNSFMQNHSARSPSDVLGKKIFELFPSYQKPGSAARCSQFLLLRNSAFTTWEQRPYLFRLKIIARLRAARNLCTKTARLFPCRISRGKWATPALFCTTTEIATNRLQLQRANHQLHIISRTDGLTGCSIAKPGRSFCSMNLSDFHATATPAVC